MHDKEAADGPTGREDFKSTRSDQADQAIKDKGICKRAAIQGIGQETYIVCEFVSSPTQSWQLQLYYTVRPRKEKTETWNNGMLWPCCGVYDCIHGHTFLIKYYHYAFEWYIVEISQVMHDCLTSIVFKSECQKFICDTLR